MELTTTTSGRLSMIIGDFNTTLFDHERRGPGQFYVGTASEFSTMVDATTIIQIPSSGRKFTWSNNHRRGHVDAVLDRTFMNKDWLKVFDDCLQKVLPCVALDHSTLLACSGSVLKPKNSPFRINNFRMDHPELLDLINAAWSINVTGSPTYNLDQKLNGAFLNFDHEVAISKTELDAIQRHIEEEGHSEQLFNLEADSKTRYWKEIHNHEKL
ncbi:uncharacterized protein LOC122092944 [Macadamia integrifolia]|uniref:uncharacterized protein LOC122092944 n=1 Tax=Macadamia integrifolia TaxID=60698 RepID=UPI001C5336EF|nr:uncharacterized protein LOC122092944 [Macadamia integrifolia]